MKQFRILAVCIAATMMLCGCNQKGPKLPRLSKNCFDAYDR